MCGIAGVISFNSNTEIALLYDMIGTLVHRGPDNQGCIKRVVNGVDIGLAHARLSIIDLTDAAKQPMMIEQYTIVFNGEIYNYREIRAELEKCGHKFITNSDTEVVIHAFDQWQHDAVHKFIGMYAFVLLDESKQLVYFYRDRAGVKPLYYYWDSVNLIFGSELKAIVKHPSFRKEIDDSSVGHYFKLGYIPEPHTIYKDTFKIESGHFAVLNLKTKEFVVRKYWDSHNYLLKEKLKINYLDAKEEVRKLMISSFNYRMVSDVPVGIFLSGGYDSTAVAAMLQKDRTEKLKTFTIGFIDWYNEAPAARATANYLGTDHYEHICTIKEGLEIVPEIPTYFDEPFADSSAIPTILVSRVAKLKVKVVLSADGGDEIFAGYDRYNSLLRNINLLEKIDFADNKIGGNLLRYLAHIFKRESFNAHRIDYAGLVIMQEKNLRASHIIEGVESLSFKIYEKLINHIKYPTNRYCLDQKLFGDPISVGQAIDFSCYLPNDILTKVDRSTMSVSLEGREPLLDHRLVEFVAQLPIEYKFNTVTRKRILKDIVYDYVPREMMDRPKMGFSLPISAWLRGDLSYLIEEYLNTNAIKSSGFMNLNYVNYLLRLFKSKKLYDESIIWKILQFQMWYKRWI